MLSTVQKQNVLSLADRISVSDSDSLPQGPEASAADDTRLMYEPCVSMIGTSDQSCWPKLVIFFFFFFLSLFAFLLFASAVLTPR